MSNVAVLSPRRRVVKVRALPDAARVFARHRSPQLLLASVLVLAVLRPLVGGWSWSDLVVAAVLVGVHPFTEWLVHVHVLHVQPRGRLSRVVDRAAGLAHRKHHEDPYDLRWQFIHPRMVYGTWVVLAVVATAWRSPAAVTLALVALGLGLVYEWVHFLIHTDVPARHWPYTQRHKAHRLHHYRNESYWLGVTTHLGDRALGTWKGKDEVPVSPTARTAEAALQRS